MQCNVYIINAEVFIYSAIHALWIFECVISFFYLPTKSMITWIVHTIFYGTCMIFPIPFRRLTSLTSSLWRCACRFIRKKAKKSIFLLLNQSSYFTCYMAKKNKVEVEKSSGSHSLFEWFWKEREKQFWIIYGTCYVCVQSFFSFFILLLFGNCRLKFKGPLYCNCSSVKNTIATNFLVISFGVQNAWEFHLNQHIIILLFLLLCAKI